MGLIDPSKSYMGYIKVAHLYMYDGTRWILGIIRGLLEDATHLIISIGLFNVKIKITHGCTLHGSVLVHTPFPLRHSLHRAVAGSTEGIRGLSRRRIGED